MAGKDGSGILVYVAASPSARNTRKYEFGGWAEAMDLVREAVTAGFCVTIYKYQKA